MAEHFTVTYGPDHGRKMTERLGENWHVRNINNVVYEQPYRSAYALPDGRFAILTTTKYGFSTRVAVFPDRPSYQAAWDGALGMVPDPEIGRVK
jgi:hypothetical protein